jgi:hypothetical protein
VKTKRGVDLAEHLLAYHQAQETYFRDNSSLIIALKQWETKFQGQIAEVGFGSGVGVGGVMYGRVGLWIMEQSVMVM